MLPQQSRMTQNWSATTPQPLGFALVWVFATNMKTLVPQHASNAVGGVKTQELPHVTVMSGAAARVERGGGGEDPGAAARDGHVGGAVDPRGWGIHDRHGLGACNQGPAAVNQLPDLLRLLVAGAAGSTVSGRADDSERVVGAAGTTRHVGYDR